MNELLRDGADDYFLTQALKRVKKMLAEKRKLIDEQTAEDEMTYKEYESFMKGKGFDVA